MMEIKNLWGRTIVAVKEKYRKYRWIIGLVILFLFLVTLYFGWQSKKPKETVLLLPQEQAYTPAGVQLAADMAKVPIPRKQAREIAEKIETIAVKTPPERVIATTGAEVKKTVEDLRQEKGADFAIVTNLQKPTEKPVLQPDQPVNLNVYNVKAYPKKLVEVSIGAHGGDIAYLHRVNISKVPLLLPKGSVGYAGPFVRTEYGGGKVDAGLRMVITF